MDISTDYVKDFDPVAFLNTYRTCVPENGADSGMSLWSMEQLHEIFSKGNIKAERMLDVGTGPSIHSVISVAPHCDNIFLSDLTPQCRKVLNQWLNNTLPHSFQPFFKFVVDKESKGESPEERESKLRKKVVGILPIDIRKPQPLEPSFFSKFQLVTTSLCFDTAVSDVSMYEAAVRNVDSLLEEGGYIVTMDCIDAVPYKVGKYTFGVCQLSEDTIKRTWQRLGYDVAEFKVRKEDCYVNGKLKMISLLVAQKRVNR